MILEELWQDVIVYYCQGPFKTKNDADLFVACILEKERSTKGIPKNYIL